MFFRLETISFYIKKLQKLVIKKAITKEFPFVEAKHYSSFRQKIENRFPECTVCRDCEVQCPTGAIKIKSRPLEADDNFKRTSTGVDIQERLLEFELDYGACISCSECIDICQTKALSYSNKSMDLSRSRRGLTEDLVHKARKNNLGGYIADKFD
ncbi:MAG: 4Fe-4S dicluster domain-containing protein [Bdellovibrionales bacterium]